MTLHRPIIGWIAPAPVTKSTVLRNWLNAHRAVVDAAPQPVRHSLSARYLHLCVCVCMPSQQCFVIDSMPIEPWWTQHHSLCAILCLRGMCMFVCVCMCSCMYAWNLFMYVYMYVCVCTCVCLWWFSSCVDAAPQPVRHSLSARCVCVCMYVCQVNNVL